MIGDASFSNGGSTMTVDVTQDNASPLTIVVNAEVVVEETTVGTFETLSDGTIAYAITGGVNESLFGITSPGGALTMNTAPTAGDIRAEYYVEVTASDDIPSSGTVLVRVTVVGVATSDSGTIFVFR